jgi:lipopolysaccharide/colanic/teichoic acid biosynthesis glycosyltransferase
MEVTLRSSPVSNLRRRQIDLLHIVVQAPPPRRFELTRCFDFTIATLSLMVAAVPMALIALLIKFDSPGPVFFRQPRIGYDNKVFWIWKFRTMQHAAADLAGSRLTLRNDPRMTRVGTWLRALSIDEVPQLLNVLMGNMALVGPRPHPIDAKAGERLYSDVVPQYALRHCVRPGLTGWAQVNGWRGETRTAHQIEQRVAHDMEYIARQSFLFNIVIIVLTLREIWRQDSF